MFLGFTTKKCQALPDQSVAMGRSLRQIRVRLQLGLNRKVSIPPKPAYLISAKAANKGSQATWPVPGDAVILDNVKMKKFRPSSAFARQRFSPRYSCEGVEMDANVRFTYQIHKTTRLLRRIHEQYGNE